MMNDDAIQALIAANISATIASLQTWRILANNGLLDPQELDEMVHGLTLSLEGLQGNRYAELIRSAYQNVLDPAMAQLYQAARANWKGAPSPEADQAGGD
ncbi:hypothetical protein [Novosphingobium sp. KA1]|uniref:hypothetical protein n=1 Tax=Novosphingobium sp. (strain KA1) TaxID=164608 RepID=UPI001A90AFF3|nr:hypothetical protein [Novosphingobium sp. KA1]QSR16038.1 hypothetical protein CA833_02305 [Novosphingobium sp. KA1]